MALIKQKQLEIEEVNACINELLLKHFDISFKAILEKQIDDIIKVIGGNSNYKNIKNFTNVLFIKYSIERTL
jgi:DNA mismatch repair ATPase MutL